MEDKTRSSLSKEGTKRKAEVPREVDFYGAIKFLEEAIAPSVNNFDRQIGYFFGSQRGNRPPTPATLRIEKSYREKWLLEMGPLGIFVELLCKDRNALLVIPGWSCQDEVSDDIDQTRICLIYPKSKGKFEAIVMGDKEKKGALTVEERNRPLYIFDVQILRGVGLTQDHHIGYDPARHLVEGEEEQTIIRLYSRKIIKDSGNISGFRVESYLGVQIKEIFIPNEDKFRYSVSYIFPEKPNWPIKNLEAVGINVNKESFHKAVNRFDEIAQGIYQIGNE